MAKMELSEARIRKLQPDKRQVVWSDQHRDGRGLVLTVNKSASLRALSQAGPASDLVARRSA